MVVLVLLVLVVVGIGDVEDELDDEHDGGEGREDRADCAPFCPPAEKVGQNKKFYKSISKVNGPTCIQENQSRPSAERNFQG